MAVSGGRDSTALWHATARAARGTSIEVVALHVHHGLQAQADDWVLHLRRQAARWATTGLPVRLRWMRLQGSPARGDSIEAWARRERYAALAAMARDEGIGTVLLAHHRRDQAETFVLQALRGAGPAGLAAMPRQIVRDDIIWMRPWLDQPGEAIEAYVRRHRLSHVDDPSNAGTRLARSRLRQAVWPALTGAFVDAESALTASARRAQEAAACLRELAEADGRDVCTAQGRLRVAAWLKMSSARRANLLRAWLSTRGHAAPETLVQRLLLELPAAPSASAWPWTGGALRLHAGLLQHSAAAANAMAPPGSMVVDLAREGDVPVPEWKGAFIVRTVATGGLEPQRLQRCELRPRCGGERFQRAAGTPPRSLKKQFQAAGVPAWQREGPLLYARGQLLFVPGLGVDARQQAPGGSFQLALSWLPDG